MEMSGSTTVSFQTFCSKFLSSIQLLDQGSLTFCRYDYSLFYVHHIACVSVMDAIYMNLKEIQSKRGAVVVVIELQWYLKLHVQSVPNTTNVVSSNRAHVVAY